MSAQDKRPKRPRDANQLAAAIVAEATAEPEECDEDAATVDAAESPRRPEKNPAAVALGRLGGKKGGKARAEKLSPERRREIAKKAAEARWRRKEANGP